MGIPLSPSQAVGSLTNLADSQANAERTEITCIADTGVKEISTITAPSTAAMAQGDYVLFTEVGGRKYAFWLDKDANGTTPTGAAYVAADEKVKVSIITGGTAAQNGTILYTAMAANLNDATVVDGLAGTVTVTQSKVGTVTDVARHNTGDTGNGSFTVAVSTQGVASNLNNKKITLASHSTTYYAWFNVDGTGADPTGTGTGIEVAMTGAGSATTIAANLALALENHSAFTATSNGAVVSLTNSVGGTATDVAVSNSGFSVFKKIEGKAATYSAATATDSISNNP